MLEQSPALADRIAGLYDHILVDEYQDTNLLQARILRGMCRGHRNITVVGDDAQSIYSFRGASFRNILDFPQAVRAATRSSRSSRTTARRSRSSTSRTRSSRAPSSGSRRTCGRMRAGGEAPWLVTARDEQQQTRFVVDRILELHEEGTPLREIAVLVRAGYMSADLEIELTNRKIPFEKWGGLKFLEAAHVKDVLAFLRVLENPRDEVSWYRILMLMPGIGDVTARAMMEIDGRARLGSRRVRALHAAAARARRAPRSRRPAAPPARRAHERRGQRRRGHRRDPRALRCDSGRTLRSRRAAPRRPRSTPRHRRRLPEPRAPSSPRSRSSRRQSTQDLGDRQPSRRTTRSSSAPSTAPRARSGTRCSSSGRSTAGSRRRARSRTRTQLEEERRLMYVAMTRARNHLAVTYPLNVYATRRGSDYSIDQLSRFIDRGVRDKMQRVVPKEPSPAPAHRARAAAARAGDRSAGASPRTFLASGRTSSSPSGAASFDDEGEKQNGFNGLRRLTDQSAILQ